MKNKLEPLLTNKKEIIAFLEKRKSPYGSHKRPRSLSGIIESDVKNSSLSPEEKELIHLLLKGYSIRSIAELLGVNSVSFNSTINKYLERVRASSSLGRISRNSG
jgi:DNA-binding NarL/FixJ family response regulator